MTKSSYSMLVTGFYCLDEGRSLECTCTNFAKLTVHLSISCQCVSVIKSNLISNFWSEVTKTSVEMAEPVTEIPISIQESVIEAVKNVTDKPPSSIEGVAIAYLSLVIMAILPIFFGSFRSVKYLKEQKASTLTVFLHKSPQLVCICVIIRVRILGVHSNRISTRRITVACFLRACVNNCIQWAQRIIWSVNN